MKKENKITTSKYTPFTFIPLNTYHQFSKYNNLFFFITLILLTIPSISPFTPYTYLLAFGCVFFISMVKDGMEDYRRHKQDKKINHQLVWTTRLTADGKIELVEKYVEDICKGDYIFVMNDQEIPGDIVLLHANGCPGHCFIETSNIDGESNLRKRFTCAGMQPQEECHEIPYEVISNTTDIKICSCNKFFMQALTNNFHPEETKKEIFLITKEGETFVQTDNHILLKGSRLKNTPQIFGVVINVGQSTKLASVLSSRDLRISHFESQINQKLIFLFIFYFIILFITSILGSQFLKKSGIEYLYNNPYLPDESFIKTGTNYILFSYLVPLSLFVMIEIARVILKLYVENDEEINYPNASTQCRNSDVIEDLGSIEYILSDKTGTLTRNEMVLKYYHFQDRIYMKDDASLLNGVLVENNLCMNDNFLFVASLLCCNTIELLYNQIQGVSQDEVCIVKALRHIRCGIKDRNQTHINIIICDHIISCTIEMIYDFSSERQRMTVVVRINDKFYVMTKGSDLVIFPKLREEEKKNELLEVINENSNYRSLIVAYREISKDEFENFYSKYQNAEMGLENIDDLFDEVENGLKYLGATFIEDLIVEDGEECVKTLIRAGIRIWMITGDKKETAISCGRNIGFKQSTQNDPLIERNHFKADEFIDLFQESSYNASKILGKESLIIYRATPTQKAIITRLLCSYNFNVLAIGDGNNDVGMLSSATVSVGIRGREGTRASLSSDFSVSQFRFLKRLIIIHGRYNLIRFSKLTINSIYKNLLLISVQFFYNFYCGYSGKPVFNLYFLNYYNLLFTASIPFCNVLFDKDYPEKYLLDHPEKYKEARKYFENPMIVHHFLLSLVTGSVIFWISYGIFYLNGFTKENGYMTGYVTFNNYFSLVVFSTVFIRQIRHISYYVSFSYIAMFISLALYLLCIFGVQEIGVDVKGDVFNLYGIPIFYISYVGVMSLVFMIDYLFDWIEQNYIIK
ncbi:putative phospholipid-transporting ATPase [Astathelohania contejeani]|uniref:Phospholipid-transporting ATPase n=1 Tax=Astathelohania contejeani TaxID=164912 RepID=A0ABQ7HZB2_9MICR|nr:putative phospholipid-transporting ATPase [Thelohania contejeani]